MPIVKTKSAATQVKLYQLCVPRYWDTLPLCAKVASVLQVVDT
jgi:hypothetical protein